MLSLSLDAGVPPEAILCHDVRNPAQRSEILARKGSLLHADELRALLERGVGEVHLALSEPGDVDEGLNAAAAVGDDRIQRRTQGRVVPDSFTHGSSADRVAAFKRGYAGGSLASCGIGR